MRCSALGEFTNKNFEELLKVLDSRVLALKSREGVLLLARTARWILRKPAGGLLSSDLLLEPCILTLNCPFGGVMNFWI